MSEKILALIWDDGHGMETFGKRSPLTNMRENEFNRAVVKYGVQYCKEHDILYKEVAIGDTDIPLEKRVADANAWYNSLVAKYGKDRLVCIYISVHGNAGGGMGCEAWIYHNAASDIEKMAKCVLDELDNLGLKNRGVHKGFICKHFNKPNCGCNFYVNGHTIMRSILIEHAFMDTEYDANLMLSESFRKQCAIADITGIVKAYGINIKTPTPVQPPKPVEPTEKKYRVRIQTFSGDKMIETGKALATFLKINGSYNDGLKEYETGNYRIDVYSYTGDIGKQNADKLTQAINLLGIYAITQEM